MDEARRQLDRAVADLLMARGHLDAVGLDRAARVSETSHEPLSAVLPKLGLVSERDVAAALSERLGIALVELGDFPDAPIIDGQISAKFLREARILPISETTDAIRLAMADPTEAYAIRAVELTTGKKVLPLVACAADIELALERLYAMGQTGIAEIVEDLGTAESTAADDVERLRDLASGAPVVRLVNLLIARAVEARASDIHIEPFENRLVCRYRIDGVLREIESPPARLRAAVVSRVKIMAKLNIAERRLPQDGRIRVAVRGKDIDMRVSTTPTMHGESVVMRILDRSAVTLDFSAIGFDRELEEAFLKTLGRPHGIILVTGPTGSGKTTTLYTSLRHLNSPTKKLFTVEDPVEYQLEGVNQVQVKPQIGLTFANVLRSILRQDPDIIMIGEIRDLETAEIAVQAALTGHLVLSTLHTNNAAGTVTRLLDMGVADYLLTSTISGIAAQRLVRTLCENCREPYQPLPELVAELELTVGDNGHPPLYRARGCPQCQGIGFLGRTSIVEFLPLTDEIRRLILRHAEAREIQRAAMAEGMRTMYAHGIEKVIAGVTTIEEVLRVTRSA